MRQVYQAMCAALIHVFSAIGKGASAVERGASALDNYAGWAEKESEVFLKESTMEHNHRLQKLEHELAEQAKALGIPAPEKTQAKAA